LEKKKKTSPGKGGYQLSPKEKESGRKNQAQKKTKQKKKQQRR